MEISSTTLGVYDMASVKLIFARPTPDVPFKTRAGGKPMSILEALFAFGVMLRFLLFI